MKILNISVENYVSVVKRIRYESSAEPVCDYSLWKRMFKTFMNIFLTSAYTIFECFDHRLAVQCVYDARAVNQNQITSIFQAIYCISFILDCAILTTH